MLFKESPPKVVRGKTVKSWKRITNVDEITQANDHYYHTDFALWYIINPSYIGLSMTRWLSDIEKYPAYRPIFKQRIG